MELKLEVLVIEVESKDILMRSSARGADWWMCGILTGLDPLLRDTEVSTKAGQVQRELSVIRK